MNNYLEEQKPTPIPFVEIRNVYKAFPTQPNAQSVPAVQDVSLLIPHQEEGDFVAFLGPSGCGKSTLLQMISGLLPPDKGEVYALGKEVAGPDAQSVTVQQAYTCFPWLSVLGNVEFGLKVHGASGVERRKIATEYLQKVGLGDRLDANPRQLSGGMQQRVAIARTLAMRLPIVLMDEPFGALDAQTRADMQEMLLSLWQAENNLVVFVTHDISEALLLANRIIVFSSRPARIVYDMQVPFERPRPQSLLYDSQFLKLSQVLVGLLKHSETAFTNSTAKSGN
ncbi:nitrate ABC transporter ATP-binding protein [Armatimonadota bacterium]|nr:nitrate ABC transporter ATP-binding protein [Armatimonadota bacterium]